MNDQNHKNKLSSSAHEPFKHVMKSMDDFFNAKPLRGVMNSLDDFFQRSFVPSFPVDLYETKEELVITAEIPGVKREQIYLDIVGSTLRISVEHEDELEEKNTVQNFYRRERTYQRSERNVQLPYPISEKQVKATYQNGLLKIRAPKGQRRKSRIQIQE
jgi:HSP20 family protein